MFSFDFAICQFGATDMKFSRFSRTGTLLLSAVVSLITGLALTACSESSIHKTTTSDTVYERVMQKGKIRCGYVVYSPGCLKDPNTGKLSGIGIDTLEMVGKNLGLKVEWTEETGWGTMLEGLQTNRYDMIATPVWTNSNRATLVDFSTPLFYSPINVWVKAGDKRFNAKNLSSLNSAKFVIATMDGETAEVIANEDFPQAKKMSLPQLSGVEQVLLNVSSAKADASFEEPAVAFEFLQHNPGSIESVVMEKPIRVFPNCWMFRRGQLEFKDMLDTALSQLMNSGAVDKIIDKYEKYPGTLYRLALPYRPIAKIAH
jgi:ABC-type amino acid transport substrate-binding protein